MRVTHLAVVALVVAVSACSAPTGLQSPKHPYDFRGYAGPDSEAQRMATAIGVLDTATVACYEAQTRQCRNRVVGELRQYIDDYWRRFKSDFNGRAGAANVAFDGTIATLAAAAPITTPISAQNIMTALAASLLALRNSAQKNLLGDQTAYALIGQMDSDRLVIGQRLANGLEMDYDHYSFPRAMSDVAEYAASMSVVSAVISMSRAGGANAQKVKDQEAEELVQKGRARAAASELAAATDRLNAARAEAAAAPLRPR